MELGHLPPLPDGEGYDCPRCGLYTNERLVTVWMTNGRLFLMHRCLQVFPWPWSRAAGLAHLERRRAETGRPAEEPMRWSYDPNDTLPSASP